MIFDPGGDFFDPFVGIGNGLLQVLHHHLPTSKNVSVVIREALILTTEGKSYIPKTTLDTGASHGNYIGRKIVDNLPNLTIYPCKHAVRLGDGKTKLNISEYVNLDIQLYKDDGSLSDPILTSFYIVHSLGEEAIIGLPDLLGSYFEYFAEILEVASNRYLPLTDMDHILKDFQKLFLDFEDEIESRYPNTHRLKDLIRQAKKKGSSYRLMKDRIVRDSKTKTIYQADTHGNTTECLVSSKYGSCYADNRVNQLVDTMESFVKFPLATPGEIIYPWQNPPESCPEEDETPDPLSFNEDILHFMETTIEESRTEYLDMIASHVLEPMKQAVPEVLDYLASKQTQEIFAPSEWNGMKVKPVELILKGNLPTRLAPKARPIRKDLFETAKQEFNRLRKYFYVESDSPIASPLVIAPKATAPFIRFCGDYREVNKFITIPQQPIPIVQHALTKAAKYKVFVDLDMTNSFHQIPLSEDFSNLLSVQMPWGLFRPKFLPEGVGPASGLLQQLVRDIFSDFDEWIIVIFDNFLILADDYRDAFDKFKKVIERCEQFGIVLKLKKSWIGATTVNFFGFEVTHGRWKLGDTRKSSISAFPFPDSPKEMQSFLGAALFFHHHVPDYSEWSAKLYEMTHNSFIWDPGKWDFDYVAHFNKFKDALCAAAELFFPDYSLPWVIRCDASQHAVGSVLFQVFTNELNEIVHQPIAFTSKTFSKPASNWDTYKREAYGLYHAVHSFSYYLRGKEFTIETDHQNLQWIESSQSPIVIRWRALLQSFSFLVRHIPGRDNKVADWLSRASFDVPISPPFVLSSFSPTSDDIPPCFDDIMRQVHSGRNLHYGASETWRRAKQLYPRARISIEAVRRHVKECPLCQKLRDTGIKGLKSEALTLKPDTYRRTIGIDHVSVTPADKNGNKCVILIVEHFAHFPQAYAAPDYSAETVAKILFKHICTFGMFDQIASDPGSSFLSDVVQSLNKWLGFNHKVSLIGRHESNGCEGTGKQFLRHLKSLVLEERLVESWSDDTVLPLINFSLCSFPTSETGGFTPFQLKYGTQDATYFKLPPGLNPGERSHEILKLLDENLTIVRELSLKIQSQIAEERHATAGIPASYEEGDFILWNPRENPCDYLETKLSPNWLGPYVVIEQIKNDISCYHINLKTKATFHVSRVKPFFGSWEEALAVALLDKNQYRIVKFNYFTGNPHLRQSLLFNVTFEENTIELPYSKDLADSQQFDEFVNSISALYPLRFNTSAEAKSNISSLEKTSITTINIGDEVFLNLRYFDGKKTAWFDALHFPDKRKIYVLHGIFTKFNNRTHTRIVLVIPMLKKQFVLSAYDILANVITQADYNDENYIQITEDYRLSYPAIFNL